jgi:glycosyltransferase involved in cell wall biosynthesis
MINKIIKTVMSRKSKQPVAVIAHGSLAKGDAIGNIIIKEKEMLECLGFRVIIYTSMYMPGTEEYFVEKKEVLKAIRSREVLLLLHHSFYWSEAKELLDKVRGIKVIRYHNITPVRFFQEYNQDYCLASERGIEQLVKFAKRKDIAFWLADSKYNREAIMEINRKAVVWVIPPFTRLNEMKRIRENHELSKKLSTTRVNKILFVSRICPNKGHEHLIETIRRYVEMYDDKVSLYIVGGEDPGLTKYTEHIRSLVSKYHLENNVFFTGKVSESDLVSYYKNCNSLLILSEHEGFAVPIIEAQALGLPVVAYSCTAVTDTLGDNQVSSEKMDYQFFASALNLIYKDNEVRSFLVDNGCRNVASYRTRVVERKFLSLFSKICQNFGLSKDPYRKEKMVMEGPFETSYSLALVNKNFALACINSGKYDVKIRTSEGPGDYVPRDEDLQKLPRELVAAYHKPEIMPDILIRDMYPPRVKDVYGDLNLLYFAWEETGIPEEWVRDFNNHLDGIMAMTRFVKDALRFNGVKVPIELVGGGGGGIEGRKIGGEKVLEINEDSLNGKFVFLHISSAFARKGVDILIKAFEQEFKGDSKVVLLIKTFPNPHNNVEELLSDYPYKNIVLVNRDLNDQQMEYLYKLADSVVYPSRGEGYGLPMLEAMNRDIPVIVTNFSGHTDFCNKDTSFLVDYELEKSGSHLGVNGSLWAKPNLDSLKRQMRRVYENKDSEAEITIKRARKEASMVTWERAVERTGRFLNFLIKTTPRPVKLGMVSTWNTKCGIATYSRYVIENLFNKSLDVTIFANKDKAEELEDEDNVVRCWNNALDKDLSLLVREVLQRRIEVVHFQFNFGFFKLSALAEAVRQFKENGVKTIITFHSVKDAIFLSEKISLDSIKEELGLFDGIIVHSNLDKEYLEKRYGLENIVHINHGLLYFPNFDLVEEREKYKQDDFQSPVVASFGYLLPHKGVLESIKAIKILKKKYRNILYLGLHSIFPNPVSSEYLKECRNYIKDNKLEKNVNLVADYLSEREIVARLRQCDLTIFPYSKTRESASGAIRFALSAERAILTTRQDIFSDIRNISVQIKNNSPELLADNIEKLLKGGRLSVFEGKTRDFVLKNNWEETGRQYQNLVFNIIEPTEEHETI